MLAMRKLVMLDAPMVMTTATLGAPLQKALLKLMHAGDDSLARRPLVVDDDGLVPVGDHVRLAVERADVTADNFQAVVERVRDALDDARRYVHVQCPTHAFCQGITDALIAASVVTLSDDGGSSGGGAADERLVALVHSNVQRAAIGGRVKAWCAGRLRVLVSTSMVGVGTHAPLCTDVLVVAYAYSVIDYVQVCGRVGRSAYSRPLARATVLFDESEFDGVNRYTKGGMCWPPPLACRSVPFA